MCIFLSLLLFFSGLGANLDDYMASKGEKVTEGHIGQKNTGQPEYFENLLTGHSEIQNICEIGFNGGHSSEVFLRTREDTVVTSFDIMRHSYAEVGKEYIDLTYPGRHTLIEGNSLESVPQFAKEHSEVKFDLIFIDGGHRYPVPYWDIVNMRELAGSDTILVIDDLGNSGVKRSYDQCIEEGIITEGILYKTKRRQFIECRYKFKG